MTMTEARIILGLRADEDPRPHLDEFRAVRERIAEMVRTAPNVILSERYQESLVQFDQALRTVREYLEALGFQEKVEEICEVDPVIKGVGKAVFVPENKVVDMSGLPPLPEATAKNPEARRVRDGTEGVSVRAGFAFLFFVGLAIGGTFFYFKVQEQERFDRQVRMAQLEKEGAEFIENRRWSEAMEVYKEMEVVDPSSEMVRAGRRSIEAGMAEEQSQFVGYWQGEVRAALDEGRWDDAEKAAREVLNKYPNEAEIKKMLASVSVQKIEQEKQAAIVTVRKMVEERKFKEAIEEAGKLGSQHGEDRSVKELFDEATGAKLKADKDREKALVLLESAKERDSGQYDEQAMKWLREAVSLAPDDAEVLRVYEKMAGYTRTVRVPEDFKTVQEALGSARDRDRIVIGEGTWEGPYVIEKSVELEGVAGKTILQCRGEVGCVVTVGEGLQDVRLTGLTMRHLSFDPGEDRYSLAFVRGGNAEFSDCRFEQGSGHGLVVKEGGHAKVVRCHFNENGWNGIAVIGDGSLLEAENCVMKENYQNGIESWEGGAVILSKNRCEDNSRNGIHIDIGAASATILENELVRNREYGLVLSRAGSGLVKGNVLSGNDLGGLVIRSEGKEVEVNGNMVNANAGPGLVLEAGIAKAKYTENRVEKNEGGNLVDDVVFEDN
jgi:tetratricopeptide (TPR) repeat protein